MMSAPIKSPEWERAADAARKAGRVLVVSHMQPDGDAIGSAMALAHLLSGPDRTVVVAIDDPVPPLLNWLPGVADLVRDPGTGPWDLMISADASDESRTGQSGAAGRANSATVINLDHHASNTGFGDIQLVKPDAVSTTEVIMHWLPYLGAELTRDMAQLLLVGLVTDTLCFRTPNVTAETLVLAQELMNIGASLSDIVQRTLDHRPLAALNVWRSALQCVHYEDGLIYAAITREDLAMYGLSQPDDSGLIDVLAQTGEARIAVLFKQWPDGRVEIQMRSRPGVDVSQVAVALGGGGHKQAAGASIHAPLDDVISRTVSLLRHTLES